MRGKARKKEPKKEVVVVHQGRKLGADGDKNDNGPQFFFIVFTVCWVLTKQILNTVSFNFHNIPIT